MTSRSTAVMWMDRLSDAVGNYYPGGRWLGPRHPVKVTLLMGLLGFGCGWVTMGVFGGTLLLNLIWGIELFKALVGALFGMLVLWPWASWIGIPPRKAAWLIVYSAFSFWIAERAGLWFTLWFNQGLNPTAGGVAFGLVVSAALSLAGMSASRDWRINWFLTTVVVNIAVALSLGLLVEQVQKPGFALPLIPRELHLPLLLVSFYTTFETVMAVCLGYLLWDRTPAGRPEFDDANPESVFP